MSIQFTLPELLEVIKEAYKTIEVRTFATDKNGTTYNVVTLIQFSISSPTVCRRNMRIRLAGHPLEKGPLQFGWTCLPATKWPVLAAQLTTGDLNVDGVTTNLAAKFPPESFKSYISNNSNIENPPPYPVFQDTRSAYSETAYTELGETLRNFVNTREVCDQVDRSGFDGGFSELARCYLGVITFNSNEPSQVAILAPVPAMIDHIEFPDARRIRADVLLHSKLRSSFRLNGDIIAGDQPPGKIKGTIRFGKLVSDKENQAHAESKFDEVDSLNDNVRLILQHIKTLRIFQTRDFSVREAAAAVTARLIDEREARHLPETSASELVKAVDRLASGDESAAITSACGAVDLATSAAYTKYSLGKLPNSFQTRVNVVMEKLKIYEEIKDELVAIGITPDDAKRISEQMHETIKHAANALEVIRRTQADAHGTKPAYRRIAYETIKWASAICGLLEGKV